MKTTIANTCIEVLCKCPYCDAFLDIFDNDNVREAMSGEPRAENCDIEITCEECSEIFIVSDINY